MPIEPARSLLMHTFVVALRWEQQWGGQPPSLLGSRGLYWGTFELGVQKVPQGPLFHQVSRHSPSLHATATTFRDVVWVLQLEQGPHAELVTLSVMSLSVLMASAARPVSGALQTLGDFTHCLSVGTVLPPVFWKLILHPWTWGPMEHIHTSSYLLNCRIVILTWKVRS